MRSRDFLTRRFGPDGENPVEAYLRRRGWKERALTRDYLAALRTSVTSLYEVSDLMPRESFRVRDLIRDGEPVSISEPHGDPDIEDTGPDCSAHSAARTKNDPGRRLARLHWRHRSLCSRNWRMGIHAAVMGSRSKHRN